MGASAHWAHGGPRPEPRTCPGSAGVEGVHRAIGPAAPRTDRKGVAPRSWEAGQGPEKHLLKWECSPHLRPQVTLPGVVDSEERPANKCRTSGKFSAFRFFSPLFLPPEAIRNGSFLEVS